MTKSALRKKMLGIRRALGAEARAEADRLILRSLMCLEAYKNARVLFTYISVNDEPDTRALIEAALADGKRVCAPKCADFGVMDAYEIKSSAELVSGKYDIPEPNASCPLILPEHIDLCVVPCVCADLHGYRLGNGGGFYDRYLQRTKAASALLCFHSMLADDVPREAHDLRPDILITDQSVLFYKV